MAKKAIRKKTAKPTKATKPKMVVSGSEEPLLKRTPKTPKTPPKPEKGADPIADPVREEMDKLTGSTATKGRPKKLTKKKKEEYIELLKQGYSYKQCASYFGITEHTGIHNRKEDKAFGEACENAYEEGQRKVGGRIVENALQHAEAKLRENTVVSKDGHIISGLDPIDILRLAELGFKSQKKDDTVKVEHSGKVETKSVIDITALSDSALNELLEASKDRKTETDTGS